MYEIDFRVRIVHQIKCLSLTDEPWNPKEAETLP